MQPACVQEVAAAIGREPTTTEVSRIEADLARHMRQLARTDDQWRTLPHEQRLQRAAEAAQAEAIADAEKAAFRRASRITAQVRETERQAARAVQLAAQGVKNPHHAALFERMRQADDYVTGVRNEYLSELVDAVQAVEPRFLGLMHDPASVRAFARAVVDGDTSDPVMAKAANTYIVALESMRLRSNAAGTDIGRLDYGYLPQPHDVGRVATAGKDGWVDYVFPRLRRERYLREDGDAMGDAEVLDLLRKAYDTIATEGRNKRVPGAAGQGSRATRFDDAHRVLHFKDADSHLDYLANFGRGSMMDAILGHVGSMAKNIGLMEEFGANPNSTYRLLKDSAEGADNTTGARASWHEFATLDMTWDTLSGVTAQPVSPRMAQFFQGVRNFTTAVKLQGVMLSSITDAPLQVLVARSAGVPMGESMKSVFRGFGKGKREIAHDLAIGMDEIAGEMARWHTDNLSQGWTAKLANSTMKLTLVEGWTNSLRRGYALTLSRALERHRHTDWIALDEAGRRRMESAGVTEADWRIWQEAPAQDGMLTKDGIRAVDASEADLNRATSRLLGYLDAEARTAVLAPDLTTRASLQQGTKAGTWGGELLRSLTLFKSFPLAIVDKHLRRLRNIPSTQGKVAYSAAMLSSLQLFGAVSLQLKDLVQGKDPRDMTTKKFWMAAFIQGGGAGIFGDMVYTGLGGENRGGRANWEGFAGPVVGTGIDAFSVARKGAGVAFGDEDPEKLRRDFGAEALRFSKGNTPFINLWYLRGATDHMVFHDLQEQLSPGYLRRMRRRAEKDWNQRYWWEPGEAVPDRAPDLEAATGER